MFTFKTCSHPNCHAYACLDGDTCFPHASNQKELMERVTGMLVGKDDVIDLSMINAEFEDIRISPKTIACANFAGCTFRGVDFSECKFTTCFFDNALFENCRFRDIDMRYSVLSGSKMLNCDCSGSMIIHTNLSGIDAKNTDFSSSDLYYSTLCSSYLTDVSFEDCNLKKTDFRFTEQRRVSFKYSNYEEAHR